MLEQDVFSLGFWRIVLSIICWNVYLIVIFIFIVG